METQNILKMKHIVFIFFLLAALPLAGQDYAYEITSEPGDSTFQLDVITIVNAARRSIQRTIGLDTTSLQTRQYTEINAKYEQIARASRQIDNYRREIFVLNSSLNSLGINDFVQWQINRNDSTFVADVKYYDETGALIDCYVFPRDNNTPIIRRDDDNSNLATILFYSRNYIRINWLNGNNPPTGEPNTFVSSNDGRFYTGLDTAGGRHRFVFETQ